jgi:hypothetical protein
MSLLTFPTLLIYGLLYGGPVLQKLGEPFSWSTHLLLGYRQTLLFHRTSPGWCGELAGKRLTSSLWVCRLHVKCRILISWCALLLRGKRLSGKEDESVRVRITFAQEGEEKKMRPKFLEHSFVREFAVVVCLSFSDLWVCFGGGFRTKKWCYDF